jgi:hypothetical protein
MRRFRQRGRGDELVSAAGISAFVFCAEAWRLEHGLGLELGNREARAVVHQTIPVDPMPRQCRACGQRGKCWQARIH